VKTRSPDLTSAGHATTGDFIARSRLLRRALEHPERTLLLIAPSGFGKSVLIDQLAAEDPRLQHRILLDRRHNDAALLAREIAELIVPAPELREPLDQALRAPDPDIEGIVIGRLFDVLSSADEPFVLALDELEWIDSEDSRQVVRAVCERLPAGSRLVIASRRDPDLQLGRLRALRGLTELRRHDLSMTRNECEAMLSRIGIALTPHQLESLSIRTEGWPAALYLAGLAIGESPDPGPAISHFAGDDRIVVEYLRDEFLVRMPEDHVDFLRDVSVPERICGDLADALLDRTGSAELLKDIAAGNSLLVPLDRNDTWYRLHPLLRDMLRAELVRGEAERPYDLNRRASLWWEQAGEIDAAVDHAIESGDLRRAGDLMWNSVPVYLPNGRLKTVEGWMRRLGDDRLAADAGLALVAVWVDLTLGRGASAERWTAIARKLIEPEEDALRKMTMAAGVALSDAALARNGIVEIADLTGRVVPLLDESSPWLALCRLLSGTGLMLSGDPEGARKDLQDAVRVASVLAPNIHTLSLTQLSVLALDDDNLDFAEREIQLALRQTARTGLADYPMIALTFAVSGLIRSLRGDLGGAAADMANGRRLLEQLDAFGSWYEVEARIALARTALRTGDRSEAVRLLAEVDDLNARIPDSDVLARWTELLRSELESNDGTRPVLLTPAELRVLACLPTYMSIPQIGDHLNVSPNTVKTHVRNLYTKLDASSRQQAVSRARELGMLTGA
jgi:LuxR family maltose regulon positive regulatory protein